MKRSIAIADVMKVCAGSTRWWRIHSNAFSKRKMNSMNLIGCAALTLFAIVPALAITNWFVNGVHGNDNNDCRSPQHACKTISNAILLTLPGDSIFVAPATYHESLFIPFTLKIIGSGAKTTIVDAQGISNQVAVVGSEPKVPVTLSGMTFRNAAGEADGGSHRGTASTGRIDGG